MEQKWLKKVFQFSHDLDADVEIAYIREQMAVTAPNDNRKKV